MDTQKSFAPYFLNIDQRLIIADLLREGYSIRRIADYLERSHTTISREIKRNSDINGHYLPHYAHELSIKKSARPKVRKVDRFPELSKVVVKIINVFVTQ